MRVMSKMYCEKFTETYLSQLEKGGIFNSYFHEGTHFSVENIVVSIDVKILLSPEFVKFCANYIQCVCIQIDEDDYIELKYDKSIRSQIVILHLNMYNHPKSIQLSKFDVITRLNNILIKDSYTSFDIFYNNNYNGNNNREVVP